MTDVISALGPDVLLRKSAVVRVTATALETSPWVDFAMSAKFPAQGGKQNGRDELKFDKAAGDFEVQFDLEDNSELNLAFLPCVSDAIWVQVGPTCPPAGPGDGNGAITPVSWSKTRLVVNNANATAETLTFMLRFSGDYKDEDHPPFSYDPRIINGGG